MARFCTECGFENKMNAKFCGSCSTDLPTDDKLLQHPLPQSAYGRDTVHMYYGKIPKRNYWFYFGAATSGTVFFLISILTLNYTEGSFYENNMLDQTTIVGISLLLGIFGSIIMLTYYYHNFNDYRNMIRKYHPNSYPTPNDPLYMLFFAITFSPVMTWFKYKQLYSHLTDVHNQNEDLPPSVTKVFIAIIGPLALIPFVIVTALIVHPIIFLLIPIASLLSGIVLIFFDNQWQVKFNQHLDYHESSLVASKS